MTLSHAGRRTPKCKVVTVNVSERHDQIPFSERHTLAQRTLIVAVELALAWGLVGLAANLYARLAG